MYYGMTRSVCSQCDELVNAQMLIRDEKVIMRKYCPTHGHSEVLVATDVDWLYNSRSAVKPPDLPELSSKVNKGCPNDCGLCDDHQQHTCFAQIEITNACDLNCSICYTGEQHGKKWYLPQDRFEFMVKEAVRREKGLNQLAITGGEPTMHPKLFEYIAFAKKQDIKGVLLFTNGVKISKDEEFVRRLADTRPTIYLSFDGFNAEVYKKTRGNDQLGMKLKALEMLEKYNISTILVPAIMRGVNEDQLGPIIEYLFKTKNVVTVQIQPVFSIGSCSELGLDPMKRMTLTDVMAEIDKQTQGKIKSSDFMYIPCHNPLCGNTNYILIDDNGNPLPLKRFVDVDKHLDYITNTSRADVDDLFSLTRENIEGIASASAVLGQQGVVEQKINDLLSGSSCCGLNSKYNFTRNIKQISIHAFMDKHTWDQNRVQKCCIHTLLPDGRVMPFCNYNIFHRNSGDDYTYENQLNKFEKGKLTNSIVIETKTNKITESSHVS